MFRSSTWALFGGNIALNPEGTGAPRPEMRDLADARPVSLKPEVAEKSKPSVHRIWLQPGVGVALGGTRRSHPALEHQVL